jgi:hypothetical protein
MGDITPTSHVLILNGWSECYRETLTMPGPFRDVEQVKRANSNAGHHFFSRDTMRFFASRVSDGVYGGRMFVTSEKRGFQDTRREWHIRIARDDGTIETMATPYAAGDPRDDGMGETYDYAGSERMTFPSKAAAVAQIRHTLAALRIADVVAS